MNKIKHILAATENCTDATPAIGAAAAFAKIEKAKLSLLHVVHGDGFSAGDDDIENAVMREADAGLQSIARSVKKSTGVTAQARVTRGAPFESIGNAMLEAKADLLVVGARKGDREHDPFGATSARLAHFIPTDILFVRSEGKMPPKKIVMATDFSDCAAQALERAVGLAKNCGVKSLTLIHAFQVPEHHVLAGHTEAQARKIRKQYVEQESETWIKKINCAGVAIDWVMIEGDASTSIIKKAKSLKADLLVVGTHGRTASSALMLGNVAERIIRNAHCSVWAERMHGHAMGFVAALERLMGIS